MANGTLFVLGEIADFAVENPLHLVFLAIASFYLLLEGYGIVCQVVSNQRRQKLDDDRVRVRELQQQLGVLRAVRGKRSAAVATAKESGEKTKELRSSSNVIFSEVTASVTDGLETSIEIQRADGSSRKTTTNEKVLEVENDDVSEEDDPFVIRGAASNVYETVKDAWTWGRHETPFSPIFEIAEGVTSQAIGLFGTDMKGLDDALKPRVADLDEHLLKPTFSNLSNFFFDGHSDDNGARQDRKKA